MVTGGAGFIGSHLVAELALRGERVRVLDNFATGSRQNLRGLGPNVEIIEGDLRDPSVIEDAVSGCNYVLHLGALGSVLRSIEDPRATNDVNVTGTLNVLMAARRTSVERIVFASSSSVYGDGTSESKVETMGTSPMSPYAASKLAGETYCQVFSRTYGIEISIVRYFNVFGPMQDPKSPYSAVIPRVITAMMDGERPVVFGDGLQSRDFTYVSNATSGTLLARDLPSAAGLTMNLGCGKSHSVLSLIEEVNQQLGTRIVPEHLPDRPGDIRHSMADIKRAYSIGYRPSVGFREGITKTIEYNRQSKSRLK